MEQWTTMDRATEQAGGGVPALGDRLRNPGLGVVLRLAGAAAKLRVQVLGGQAPVRLSLYVDGDLQASADIRHAGNRRGAHAHLSLRDLTPGRHALTVRAIDAAGRWGGASMVASVPGPVPARATRDGGMASDLTASPS